MLVQFVLEQVVYHQFGDAAVTFQQMLVEDIGCYFQELEHWPCQLMWSVAVLHEDGYNLAGFGHEGLKAWISDWNEVFAGVIDLVLLTIEPHILLDGKDERSDCAALGLVLVTSKSDKDDS